MKLKNHADPFVPNALNKANQQTKKMTNLINGFLNVSRLESGKLEMDEHPFNLIKLDEELIDETRLTSRVHEFKLDAIEAISVYGDRGKIDSVIRICCLMLSYIHPKVKL